MGKPKVDKIVEVRGGFNDERFFQIPSAIEADLYILSSANSPKERFRRLAGLQRDVAELKAAVLNLSDLARLEKEYTGQIKLSTAIARVEEAVDNYVSVAAENNLQVPEGHKAERTLRENLAELSYARTAYLGLYAGLEGKAEAEKA